MGHDSTPRAGRTELRRAGIAAGAVLYAAALVFLRGRPSINGDGGIFLSVAAGLRRGYALYSGVWDNKPPLFYYAGALGDAALGWRGVYLLDVAWLAIAAIGMTLWLSRLGSRRVTIAAGTLAYPLFLTGVWYYAGYSELPALAVVPVVAWLWGRGARVGAGLVIGALAFERPEYAPLYAAVLLVPVAAGELGGADLARALLRGLAGLAAGVAGAGAVVAARGELGGYLRTLAGDLGYPGRVLAYRGELPSVPGHLAVAGGFVFEDATRGVCFVVATLGAVILTAAWLRRPSRGGAPVASARRRLAAGLALTAAGVLVILGLGALWRHGMEVLAMPGALTVALAVESAAQRQLGRLAVAATALAALGVVGLGVGGLGVATQTVGGSPESGWHLSAWWRPVHSIPAEALDAAARGSAATYARIGTDDDGAHLAFVASDLRLVCPIFAQYPFDNHWSGVLGCLERKAPDLVAVSPRFVAQTIAPAGGTASGVAARSARGMLAIRGWLETHYVPVVVRHGPGGGVVVWARAIPARAAAAPGGGRLR